MPRLSKALVPALVSLALLLPLLFASPRSTTFLHLGLPRVFTGDEPHYLVMINSMLLDGDLDLANNYGAAHEGAPQAGKYFSGDPFLAHHTVWFEHGLRRIWYQIYELDPARFGHDDHGRPVPQLRPGETPPLPTHPEFSTHPPGVTLLLAPILFPFRGSKYIEPLAIGCSALAMVLAMFLFRSLTQKYSSDIHAIDRAAVVAFLGTPAWFYGRTLFNEPYLLLFAIGAYSVALRGKSPLLAGGFIGLGVLMKPPFALLIIPLCLMYLAGRDLRSAVLLLLPPLVSVTAVLSLNNDMFGSPWRAPQEWLQGSLFTGAAGIFFSLQYGYLITAPAIVIALASWPVFFRAYPRDAIVLALAIMLYFVFFASYATWSGATCYSARYTIPVLPLLFIALVKFPETWLWQKRWTRYGTVAICTMSVVINGVASLPYWKYWDSNPVLAMMESRHLPAFIRIDREIR